MKNGSSLFFRTKAVFMRMIINKHHGVHHVADLRVALFPFTFEKEQGWRPEVDEEREGATDSYFGFCQGREWTSYHPQSTRHRGERCMLHYISGCRRRPMVRSHTASHASRPGNRDFRGGAPQVRHAFLVRPLVCTHFTWARCTSCI